MMLGGASLMWSAGPALADSASPPVPLPSASLLPCSLPTGDLPTSVPTSLPSLNSSTLTAVVSGAAAEASSCLPSGLPVVGSSGGSSGSGGSGSSGGSGTTGGSGGSGGTHFTGKVVNVSYQCVTPIGNKSAVSPVQINADKNGGDFGLTVHFSKSVMNSPASIPANSVKPSMKVKLGGADSGEADVAGPTNPKPINAGDPIVIPDLTGTYKPGASGSVTLTPGVLTVNALGTTTTCTPASDPGVSLTLDTSAQGGSSSGSSASGGTSGTGGTSGASGSSGTSGGLAQTGASDIGSLHALGLVAGTVILLGGAIFTFTPWRRLRR